LIRIRPISCLILALLVTPAAADLSYVVQGVDGRLRSNILGHINVVTLGRPVRLSERDYDSIISKAIANARRALRPFGYYEPEIVGNISLDEHGKHVLQLQVDPGAPIIISAHTLEVKGEGADQAVVRRWQRKWPLKSGDVLDQTVWEGKKQFIIDAVEALGFLNASFDVHTLALDLDANTAALALVFDTGPQFYMGEIDFGEHPLKPGILEYVPRFSKGDPYTARLMDKFRGDLWRTGYFTNVAVEEEIRADTQPPSVDLHVESETKTRDNYQGALGFGSDTGMRLQGTWSRHPMSSNGDRIDVGIGWQEINNEFALRSTYRKPRRNRGREYWTADLILSFENQDLEFKRNNNDREFIKLANGEVDERGLRLGRLKIRNFKSGDQQLFTTPFVQVLNGRRQFQLIDGLGDLPATINNPDFDRLFRRVENALSGGIDMDLVSVNGKGFQTHGHRERAWAFTANESLGSNVSFTQIYASSRRSYIRNNHWKFLLRAAVGYTDAKVDRFSFDIDNEPLDLSITRLPSFYRFKAGGSQSVRGYSFEQLSNNNVGSNHLLTASAELERKFRDRWSIAAFIDIGNAFNDWSSPNLKKGIGIGIRWYSIAGPIRIDVAQAIDIAGKPWRLHFTIGTPLL